MVVRETSDNEPTVRRITKEEVYQSVRQWEKEYPKLSEIWKNRRDNCSGCFDKDIAYEYGWEVATRIGWDYSWYKEILGEDYPLAESLQRDE